MTDSAGDKTPVRTIFCATDFSETAKRALEHALRLARRHDARIVLAHVVEPIPLGPYPALRSPSNELEIRAMAVEHMDEVAKNVRADGFEVTTRVEQGSPGSGLIALADDEGADIFVIGTRGLSGIAHLMLGSTAEYVVRRCACPVLTIHPDDTVPDGPVQKILVPTNLSSETTACVDAFSVLFPDGDERRILLTFADRTPPYLEPFRHDTLLAMNQRDVVKEEIERRMEGIVAHFRKAGFEVETAVIDGEPVGAVTKFAEKREVDAIVMTSQGRSAILNAVLGKTAQRIVQHAPCPVLTVRP